MHHHEVPPDILIVTIKALGSPVSWACPLKRWIVSIDGGCSLPGLVKRPATVPKVGTQVKKRSLCRSLWSHQPGTGGTKEIKKIFLSTKVLVHVLERNFFGLKSCKVMS